MRAAALTFWLRVGWLSLLLFGCATATTGSGSTTPPPDYGPAPTIEELVAEGRNGVLRRAAEDARRRLPSFNLWGFDRIRARRKGNRVRVAFEMPVRFIPPGATARDHHYRVTVEYSPERVEVTPSELHPPPPNPFWPLPLSGPAIVLPSHVYGSIHDTVEVEEEVKGYAISVLHGDGTAEGYYLRKAGNIFEMVWTEVPPKGERVLQRDRHAAADGWEEIR